jgi:hypothetical protein
MIMSDQRREDNAARGDAAVSSPLGCFSPAPDVNRHPPALDAPSVSASEQASGAASPAPTTEGAGARAAAPAHSPADSRRDSSGATGALVVLWLRLGAQCDTTSLMYALGRWQRWAEGGMIARVEALLSHYVQANLDEHQFDRRGSYVPLGHEYADSGLSRSGSGADGDAASYTPFSCAGPRADAERRSSMGAGATVATLFGTPPQLARVPSQPRPTAPPTSRRASGAAGGRESATAAQLLNSDGQTLSVWIRASATQADANGRYTAYELAVSDGARAWSVWRRYSQFEVLHRYMLDERGFTPGLPPKAGFAMRPRVVAERRAQLERYVCELVANPRALTLDQRAVLGRFLNASLGS